MKTKEIKQLFENMNIKFFEINLSDYIATPGKDEYTYCYINYNEVTNMLQYGGATNAGFNCEYEIEFDKYFSIDENLQSLLELFVANSITEYYNEN